MNCKLLTLLGFFTAFLLGLNSCNQLDNLEEDLALTIDLIDNGIDVIGNESQGWRLTLEEISENLPEGFHYVREDIGQLLSEGIGAAGSNIICVVDAIPNRIIRGLQKIKAQLLRTSLPKVVPTVCQVSMPVIDLNQPDYLRRRIVINGYDFRNGDLLHLELHSFAGDSIALEQRLTKQSHYQYTINIAEMEEEWVKWDFLKMKFEEEVISEWSIIHIGGTEMETIGFIPPAFPKLCPDHIGGDEDFDENGPLVRLNAKAFIVGEKEVWIRFSVEMKETTGDETEAVGEWQAKVWPNLMSPPPTGDYRIVSFASSHTSSATYVDNDELVDYPIVLGRLVHQFRSQADTKGKDFQACDDDDENTNVSVTFNELKIEIERL